MSDPPTITGFRCPGCKIGLEVGDSERTRCPNCAWRGTVMTFHPIDLKIDGGQAALSDDAACVHHPSKRAEAICAGTGDYICALCSIDHGGQVFSAEYLNTAGANTAGKAFDRTLDRPDRTVRFYIILCFIPYINVIWYVGWPVWVSLGWMKLLKARRLSKSDPLMARLVGPTQIVLLAILLGVVSLLFLVGSIYLMLFLFDAWSEGFASD